MLNVMIMLTSPFPITYLTSIILIIFFIFSIFIASSQYHFLSYTHTLTLTHSHTRIYMYIYTHTLSHMYTRSVGCSYSVMSCHIISFCILLQFIAAQLLVPVIVHDTKQSSQGGNAITSTSFHDLRLKKVKLWNRKIVYVTVL